ncbi:hypothetical protein glysoja_043167 [Glycine soja]|uniref:Pectin acetylesterase n=1 Tax=Glycine soja TaxID=3848 RepID=A0A0B2Q2E4_GLYSO|nr:hypothetical protein glysoja_043167 [Glycine soja]
MRMGNLFWLGIVAALVFSFWVDSFSAYEYHHFNETEFSLLESQEQVHSSLLGRTSLMVGLTVIQSAAGKGAVCLDGTLPAYHLHRGYGSGANSWIVNLEGGGWCNDVRSCVYRKKTRRFFPQTTKVKCLSDAGLFLDAIDVSRGHTIRNFFSGDVRLQGVQKNLPHICTSHLDPTSCFFPQNLIAGIRTPLFILNTAYDSWQVQSSLAPSSADPHGFWHDCRLNHAKCTSSQIQYLQGFRNQMLNAIKGFSRSPQNGLFINSCFAHCQSERQDTWFADNSPVIGNKAIALSVGDWYFDRAVVKAIDCPYPCDNTCHHLVFR